MAYIRVSTVEENTGRQEVIARELGAISKMLKASDDIVQTDLYKALRVANTLGILPTETRFNEPLSKSEAIELLINTAKARNLRDGCQNEIAHGDTSTLDIIVDTTEYATTSGDTTVDGDTATEDNKTSNQPTQPVSPPATSKPETSKPASKPVTLPSENNADGQYMTDSKALDYVCKSLALRWG